MPIITTKTMLLEALASNERLAGGQEGDREVLHAVRKNVPQFVEAFRKTLHACEASLTQFEADLMRTIDDLDARMEERLAMMRDGGAVPQDADPKP